MNSTFTQNKIEAIQQKRSIHISIDKLSRGIDNYHVDIKLSRKFSSDIKKLITLLVSQLAVPKPKQWDNSRGFEKVRESYLDLMTILIHRVKTDLSADEISFLQFAPIKHILKFSRSRLDDEIRHVNSRLTEHRNTGSSEALATDQRLFWLKKNYDSILYRVNNHIFNQLQRVEDQQLVAVRSQFLGEEYNFCVDAIINPLLYTSKLSALPLLLKEYSAWSWNSEDSDFIDLNSKIESLFSKRIKQIETKSIRENQKSETAEIHDDLGGLFQVQSFLGAAADTKTRLYEDFYWLDQPANIELLFDAEKNTEELSENRKSLGFKKWWRRRSELKRLQRTLAAFVKLLRTNDVLPQLLASHYMRKSLNPLIMEVVDLKIVCQFLSGHITSSKLQDSITSGSKLNNEQMKSLESLKNNISSQINKADLADSMKLLCDFSRYRQNLKYFRFAHRAFNRFTLLTNEDDLKLSKSANTLYLLPTSSEIEEDDERVCHHTILKADVRGSTMVTDELQAKGLNPASYFSTRFFNPINKILETYGANKVFIEGDAIILSFLEYEHTPQQWFSVARSCGYARDMLKITGSNNRYSQQMGLPLLELGVGICYSDESPRYLYDEEKPIMISSAIGLADRMSSCSWNLRTAMQKSLFSIDVLRITDSESNEGKKGQHHVRYNVNGILIDDAAFNKLRLEIPLRTFRMKINAKEYLFHVGRFPDANGRNKDLVIREGKVGIWRDSQILEDPDSNESYYEVVVNRKVILLVLEATAATQSAEA